MSAVNVPIEIEQGATFFMSFIWANDAEGTEPIDLTGVTARMQIRKTQQEAPLIDALSTGGSPMITLGGATGVIDIKIPATATSVLTLKSALYDLEAVMANGDVYRVIEGAVTIKPNITQATGEPVLT